MLQISLNSTNRIELEREVAELKKVYGSRIKGLNIEQGRKKPGWFAYATIEPQAVVVTINTTSADERWQAALTTLQTQELPNELLQNVPVKTEEKEVAFAVNATIATGNESTPITARSSNEASSKQKKSISSKPTSVVPKTAPVQTHPVQQILHKLLTLKEAATWAATHQTEFGLVSAPKYDAMKNACHSGELEARLKGDVWYTTPAKVAKYLQNYVALQNVPKRLGGKSSLAANSEETGNISVQTNIQDYDDLDLEQVFKRLLILSEASDWTSEHLQDYGLKRSISKGTLQDAALEGRLIAFQKSNVWLLDKSDLEKYVRNYNQQAEARKFGKAGKQTKTQRHIRQLERTQN